MKRMSSTLLLTLLSVLLQSTSIDVSVATVPSDSRVDLLLMPNGEVEIRRDTNITRVKVKIDRTDPLTASRRDFRAWVVWAVSPEGEFENLGELKPDGRGAELETVTSLTRLGIMVTSEPHFRVESPSSEVAFRSGMPRDNDVRADLVNAQVGMTDYSAVTLPPQGSIHPRVSEARMAIAIAEASNGQEATNTFLRQARVAVDSMEQLLRRATPLDVVLNYANEAIRLSDLAMRQSRTAEEARRLMTANDRVRDLEASLALSEEDRGRATTRERDATTRINELLAELEAERDAKRELTLERDAAQRDLAGAQAQVRELQDPWPPLVRALVYGFAARETPRGLVLTLYPETAFSRSSLTGETREWLARLSGVLGFGEAPEVWVEGHSRRDNQLKQSEERAAAIRDYLVEAGLPDSMVHSQGLGASVPVPGTEDNPDDPLNERIEIVIREFSGV